MCNSRMHNCKYGTFYNARSYDVNTRMLSYIAEFRILQKFSISFMSEDHVSEGLIWKNKALP